MADLQASSHWWSAAGIVDSAITGDQLRQIQDSSGNHAPKNLPTGCSAEWISLGGASGSQDFASRAAASFETGMEIKQFRAFLEAELGQKAIPRSS